MKNFKLNNTMSNLTEHNQSVPFVFKIKNNTDEKHYEVNLFKQNAGIKIEVSHDGDTFEVSEFVKKHFNDELIVIGQIILESYCDYPKFAAKQIRSEIIMIEQNIEQSSIISKQTFSPLLDLYQMHPNMSVIKNDRINIIFNKDEKTDILIKYLMPETELFLIFYPQKIEHII